MARDPYPLQWPDGWTRTKFRKRPAFSDMFGRDRDRVLHQLKRLMHARHVVITSNLPVRGDGLPYASAPKQVADPGVAVYWVDGKGRERVIACDRWITPGQNLRAIDMSLEAIRGLDRWGATEMVERAFAGFAALPPGTGEEVIPSPRVRPWREILGLANGAHALLERDDLLALAKVRHRRLIKDAHPDAGGDATVAAEINAALEAAERELAP